MNFKKKKGVYIDVLKSPFNINLTLEEKKSLKKIISKGKSEHRLVFRCSIILLASQGLMNCSIAKKLKVDVKTISHWRKNYYYHRLEGLYDKKRSGRPKKFDETVKYEMVHIACSNADLYFKGLTKWSYRKLALALIKKKIVASISFTRVMTWLKSLDLKPQKVRYYLNQTYPNFEEKMYDIIRLYHHSSENEPIICVDEKTGIQVLKPVYDDIINKTGEKVYREFAYERKGTVTLLAGYNVKTGKVSGIVKQTHKTKDFIELLCLLKKQYHEYQKVHIVLDNFSTHKSKELREWQDKNGDCFVFHYLPFHGSWLNQVEIWFSIFKKDCLKNAKAESIIEMSGIIFDYIKSYNKYFSHPFNWQYGKDLLTI